MQKTLTKEELAARINGRAYRDEITPEEEKLAKENSLVVIFGASDDLIELRGAINEEIGAGSVLRLSRKGIPESDCKAGDECACYKKWLTAALKRREVLEIPVCWGGEGMDSLAYNMFGKPTWCFDCETLDGKFSTFDIFDEYDGDTEYFCRGVIIDLDEVWPSRNYTQIVMEQGGWES